MGSPFTTEVALSQSSRFVQQEAVNGGLFGESKRLVDVGLAPPSPAPPGALRRSAAVFLCPWQSASGELRPHPSNTRAQTQGEAFEPVRAMPDWLEGWLPDSISFDGVLDMLGRGGDGEQLPWTVEEHKRSGAPIYSRGHVRIMDVVGKGAYVTISGQGCRELEGDGVVVNWQAFCLNLWAIGFKGTRFDVAFDDRGGVLPFEEIKARTEQAAMDWSARSFTTRAKSAGGQWSGGVDRAYGYTLGFGIRGSETYVRIYDKAAQTGTDEPWTRVELEWRRERADAAIAKLGNEGLGAIVGVLRSHLEFREAGTHTRIENCDTAPWWLRFVKFAEKAQLEVNPVVRSVEKSVDWLHKQVAPALALVLSASGYGWEAVAGLAVAGLRRMRKSHQEMLQSHENNFARGLARIAPLLEGAMLEKDAPEPTHLAYWRTGPGSVPSWPDAPVFAGA